VLDACAAPGNKTLQLSCLNEGQGVITAVEKNPKRFSFLKHYMKKFNLRNVTAYRTDLLQFSQGKFDKILLDAPCSSEGFVRKKRDALANWSEELVRKKAMLQKELLIKAFELLSPKGTLIYSTCSFSLEENEEVISHLLSQFPAAKLQPIEIKDIKIRPGIIPDGDENTELKKCARIFPQDNNTEQFFMAKIVSTSPHG